MKKNILRNKALIAYVSSLLLLGSAIAYEVTTEEVTITTEGRVVVNRNDQASKTTIGAIQGDVKLESKSGDTLSMKVGETKIVDEDGNIADLSSEEYMKIIEANDDLNDAVVMATVKEPESLLIVENTAGTLSVKLNKRPSDEDVVVKFYVVGGEKNHLIFQGNENYEKTLTLTQSDIAKNPVPVEEQSNLESEDDSADYEKTLTFTKSDWNTTQDLVITAKEIAGDDNTDSKIYQTIKVGEDAESSRVEIPIKVIDASKTTIKNFPTSLE